MTRTLEDPMGLIRGFLEPGPSMALTLDRIQNDGSIKAYPIRMRLLRIDEEIACKARAQELARKAQETAGITDIYQDHQAVEVLSLAVCKPDFDIAGDGTERLNPLFANPQQMRQALTVPELAQLLNAYDTVKEVFNPLEDYSGDKLEWMIEQLVHPLRGPLFISQLGSRAQPRLLEAMAHLIQDLRLALTTSDSQSSSESDPPKSEQDTTSSTSLPGARFTEDGDEELPRKRVKKSEASTIAKKIRAKKRR